MASTEKNMARAIARWLRRGTLTLTTASILLSTLATRLRERATVEYVDVNYDASAYRPTERIVVREKTAGLPLVGLLTELKDRPSSGQLWKRGEELKVELAERTGKLSQAVVERGHDIAERGSELSQELARRSEQATRELTRRSRQATRDLSEQDKRIWILLGFAVGLIATGVGAFLLVRRRVIQTGDEAPPIQLAYNTSPSGSISKQETNSLYPAATPAAQTVNAPVPVTRVEPTQVANDLTRGMPAAQVQGGQPTTAVEQGTAAAAATHTAKNTNGPLMAKTAAPMDAAFVGIVKTRRYYPVEIPLDQLAQPGEKAVDILYFASEDEARAQGFSAAQ